MNQKPARILRVAVTVFLSISFGWGNGIAVAQNSSLYNPTPRGQNAMVTSVPSVTNGQNSVLDGTLIGASSIGQTSQNASPLSTSWYHIPTAPTRVWKIHDPVSIRVDQTAQSTMQGTVSSRKNTAYDAKITDWIKLEGWAMGPSAQPDGDPRVAGQENEIYRADSTLRTRESYVFNIEATVTDIRPNGMLVLTGTSTIMQNDNISEYSVSGTCRAEDIGPDNVILSRNIAELRIEKNDRGHVRDGYSRGWFTKFLAKIKPF